MPAKLKIEINTTEHFQVLPLRSEEFNVNSDWWSGNAKIATYEIDELMATKLRALYQRRKGRDLFNLWYVIKNELINLDRVFEPAAYLCKPIPELLQENPAKTFRKLKTGGG